VNESTLRTMLAERAEQVDVGHALVEEARREGQRMRRRRSVLVASLGTAAVVVAVAAAAVVIRPGADAGSLPTTQQTGQNNTSLPGDVPTEDDLVGTWLAVGMLGEPASRWGMTTEQMTLAIRTANGRLIWTSQEVCNLAGGRADLGPGGELSTDLMDMTLINCPATAGQPTVPQVVMKASLVRIGGDTLTFYGQDGSPLATFEAVDGNHGLGAESAVFVPDVIGRPTAEARQVLEDSGLTVDVVAGISCPDGVDCDSVTHMDPAPGTPVHSGTSVSIVIGPRQADGSLSPSEYTLAVATAKQVQNTVTGTFIGATAFAAEGPERCPLHIRLVWRADASFVHGGVPGLPPDGPRKALLISVDPQTGDVCGTSAKYRDVGAAADETLLYGHWPG
jgi:PASTA domain